MNVSSVSYSEKQIKDQWIDGSVLSETAGGHSHIADVNVHSGWTERKLVVQGCIVCAI